MVRGSRVGVAFLGRTGEVGGVLRLWCACAGQGGPKLPGVTTLTPAEQAGGESGAQVSGIPAQRTGQALRLLVLGAGTSADSARERAAAAGAEIAQRFSNRVTHVIVDESVGAEDPRVVRAQSAGVPVLRVDEVAGLVGPEGAAGPDRQDLADGMSGAVVTEAMASATAAADKKEGMAPTKGARVGAGGVGDVGRDGDAGRSALVESAAGLAGVKDYNGSADPAEAHAPEASPLESALVFPPLPAEVIRDGVAVGEAALGGEGAPEAADGADGARTEGTAGVGVGVGVGVDVGASAEAWAEARARAEGVVRTGAEEQAAEAVDVRAQGGVRAEVEDEVAAKARDEEDEAALGEGGAGGPDAPDAPGGVRVAHGVDGVEAREGSGAAAEAGPSPESGPEVASAPTAGASMSASTTAVSLMWAAVPLVSMGLLTPVSLGYAAYRLRSRRLAAATACYTVAVSIAFAISATHPSASDARTSAASGGVLTACLAASWAGGTIHSFLIRRRVFR